MSEHHKHIQLVGNPRETGQPRFHGSRMSLRRPGSRSQRPKAIVKIRIKHSYRVGFPGGTVVKGDGREVQEGRDRYTYS